MDDMRSLEDRIAAELGSMAGPEPPVDAMAVTRSVAATGPRRRERAFFGALTVAAGAIVVASFAGFLLFGGILDRSDDPDQPVIGASPSATAEATPSPAASTTVEASTPASVGPSYLFSSSAFDETARFELSGIAVSPSGLIVVSGNRHGGDTSGRLWSSPDGGATWTRTTIDGVEWMADVRAFGDGFAAYGVIDLDRGRRSAVWTSGDGLAWKRRLTVGNASVSGWISDARGLAVLGAQRRPAKGFEDDKGGDPYHTVVWTSEDGITWQSSVISPPLSRDEERQVEQHALARSNDGTIVVAGTRVIDDPEEPRFAINRLLLWRSDDGETWQSVDVPEEIAHRSSYPVSLVWSPAGFLLSVAGTSFAAGDLWTSVDGRAWQRLASAESTTFQRVVTDGFILLGMRDLRADTPMSLSADGLIWEPIEVSGATGTFTAMTLAPDGRILAAGFERQPGVNPEPGFDATPFVWIGERSE